MRIGRGSGVAGRAKTGETVLDPTGVSNSQGGGTEPDIESDAIEISSTARSLQSGGLEAGSAGGVIPEGVVAGSTAPLDAAQLEIVRTRIENGHYDTRQITEVIAQRLLELLGLVPPGSSD
jgi:hypothetical protein